MSDIIRLKRSNTPGLVPDSLEMSEGELAINTFDGILYAYRSGATPVSAVGGRTIVYTDADLTLTTDLHDACIVQSSAGQRAVYIPSSSQQAIRVGSTVQIIRLSGSVEVWPCSGVTLYAPNGRALKSAGSSAYATKIGEDEWVLHGDTSNGDWTLSFDFTTNALDSRLTLTRATVGTYIDSLGFVASAASGVARFTHDPVTLERLGLLCEHQTTNRLNFSETFAATGGSQNNWTTTNLTRTSTNNLSPRNDLTALRLTATAANATIIASAAIGSSAQRTLSVWLRRVTGTGSIQYTTNNGSTYTTQAITSTWTRYTFAATTEAQQVGFRVVTSGDAIEIWGAQVEDGGGSSSYIVTTTATATRNGDQLTMSDISALGYSTTAGTLYHSGRFTYSNSGSYPTRAGFMTAGDQPTWEVFTNGSRLFSAARGSGAAPEANLTYSANTATRFAASFDASLSTAEVKINLNGSATSAGPTSLSATFTPTRFVIGRPGYELYFSAGPIAKIKYWPTIKTATELAGLVT
jgi:hypothetical protein